MTTNDGGPAFPGEVCCTYFEPGMSLRDWFAGQALPAMMQMAGVPKDPARCDAVITNVAAAAYQFADAMLAAREGGAK